VAGQFTLTREGDFDLPLTVNLLISGNATNGVDYQNVPSSITIPIGQASAVISILPYVDLNTELNETVSFQIADSSGYIVGSASTAQVVIEDLKPQLTLEVDEAIAGVANNTYNPGQVLIRRGGLLSTSFVARFTFTGTATNGIDYDAVTNTTFSAGDTMKLITFQARPSVNFGSAEAKTIRMTIKPDAAFISMVPSADLVLAPQRLSYAQWLATRGANASDDELLRYGFSQGTQPSDNSIFARTPKATVEDGYLTLRFRKKPGVSDLNYQVEYSNNFTQWQTGPDAVEDITSQVAPNDPGAAVFRSKKPISAEKAASMRVKLLQTND
jgi:hypothetical protein